VVFLPTTVAAAYFGGVLRTDLGRYLETFMLSGTLCFAAALLVMWIGVDRRGTKPVAATAAG
jgi:hypothetical protein